MNKMDELPFLYGAQYYRAPTPERTYWEADHARMKAMGCNAVKYWVQWRWSERNEGEFVWDDLDKLLIIADRNGLKVILNLILDVMPVWAQKKYPNSLMMNIYGHQVLTSATICRQIGGYPGPCYSHEEMRLARERFFRAALQHFKGHPALWMWDVWNEPENHHKRRTPVEENLLCYCPSCDARFKQWLQVKYGAIGRLNEVWGRCYQDFDEVELPRDATTISDFVDWREFHLDKLTDEANWRLRLVKELDPQTISHLHVVPNTGDCFNFVTCVDDFALAKECDVFASTMMQSRLLCAQAISAARGKFFYNAEWHINFGSTSMHQRVIDWNTFLYEALPQLGWGVRGFLYWQFRAETLGLESPAWGLVRPDGSDRPVTRHAERFIEMLSPYINRLMKSRRAPSRIGVFRSRKNEIFHFCIEHQLKNLHAGLELYSDALYELNLPFRFIDGAQLESDALEGLALLILPSAYFLSVCEADALDRYLQQGGVVVADGHLGGYDATTGRHSPCTPGCGLAARWGIIEAESTSSFHLDFPLQTNSGPDETGDVQKALCSSGTKGAEYFPFNAEGGIVGWGARSLATLSGENIQVLGNVCGNPCVIRKPVGKGTLFYAGTLLGLGATHGRNFLLQLLCRAAEASGIERLELPSGLHADVLLSDSSGEPEFIILQNTTEEEKYFPLDPSRNWRSVFSDFGRSEGEIRVAPLSAMMIDVGLPHARGN